MNRYITTTLPYVNADPHIGFALEVVQADVLARAWRLQGRDVFFSTGTDEHGQKVFEAAQKVGQDVQAYADHFAGEFKKMNKALAIQNDVFIRTTDPAHIEAAQEMWRRCTAKNDIYKKSYTGLYCVGCEAFKAERDTTNNRCTIHPNLELREITEENYFFRFSKYTDQLLAYLDHPGVIVPEWKREEAIAFVKNGLEDFSISREKARLSWGVPVPGDDSQVMYVWFDALTNYLSTLGWPEDAEGNFKKYWQEGTTLQLAGKDQVRFQSLMWQAMLFSVGVKNTDTVFYHGHVTSGGIKMSKSMGNVINPLDLVTEYGTDTVRYILLRHMSPTEDSDLTREAVQEFYTAHLANGLGNLVARVMKLAETHLSQPIAASHIESSLYGTWTPLDSFQFHEVMDSIWQEVQAIDQVLTNEKPFEVIKTDSEKGKKIIIQSVEKLYAIAWQLAPFMPTTSEEIITAIRTNKKPDNLFPRIV